MKITRPKITPGEWIADNGVVWFETSERCDVVATTKDRADAVGFDPKTLKPEELANARAIAALPILLEALECLAIDLNNAARGHGIGNLRTKADLAISALTSAGYEIEP